MAKNFGNAGANALAINKKILVGDATGDTGGTATLAELKFFLNGPGVVTNKSQKRGLLIPMYVYPTDAYTNLIYQDLIGWKKSNPDIPMIVIINPSNGPGAVTDGNYTMVINNMKAAGIRVIGYISTNYRAQTVAQVKADIDGYATYYPGIEGVFFDEQSDGTTDLAAELAYYREVADYSRSIGFMITVSNPGVNSDNGFYEFIDIVVEWENNVVPTTEQQNGAWPGGKIAQQRAILLYGMDGDGGGSKKVDSESYLQNYGWLYYTEDDSPNPWDSFNGADLVEELILWINGKQDNIPDPPM